jgi:hypothetical protein
MRLVVRVLYNGEEAIKMPIIISTTFVDTRETLGTVGAFPGK